MERGAGGGQHQPSYYYQTPQQPQPHHHHHYQHSSFMTSDEYTGKSSFDNPATKKKPPKLKAISRSISMAIYDDSPHGDGMDDSTLVVEQPLIHRSASPVAIRSAPPPQTLALPPSLHHSAIGGGSASGAVSPALSARQHQQQHLRTFHQLAAQARQYSQQHQQQQQQHQQSHSSSASSPIAQALSPVLGGGPGGSRGDIYRDAAAAAHHHHQPDIFLLSSTSLADDPARTGGPSTSPIQFIDDYMVPPSSHRQHAATHPLKKSTFRRSDTIDVHPVSNFQMKKTHSFHAPQDTETIMDPLLLGAAQPTSASSSRRTSSVRGNFLMPGHASGKDHVSRSPSPSRRGARSHRSLHDPNRRPSSKHDAVADSQIRHSSLNDDLMDPLEARGGIITPANLSLENELFVESRSRSNSHTKMDEVGGGLMATDPRLAMRKTSGSFEDGVYAAATTSSLKKRADHSHTSRQISSHSLELDGRPSTSAAAAVAAVSAGHSAHSSLHLHSAAAAATAAYHFKRGTQHGRSLYLSPNNLEEVQVHHRPTLMAAAAAFGGTNASATSIKQAKALHSASMRLRTYRETLSATKKSKSFISDGSYPLPVSVSNEFVELTSPHRRNSGRAMATATASQGAATIEEIKRSPRPISLTSSAAGTGAATTAFIEEKRPSFERKQSLTYELSDAAFEQVLRPFHHKATGLGARKASLAAGSLKKKSLSDETDEEEDADRKRKRIVCIVMTVFLCLVCASVFVVIMTLTHSSSSSAGQTHSHHHLHHGQTTKKTFTYNRDVPVHYNVRQENERLMKETMDRARYGKNLTETASSLLAATTSSLTAAFAQGQQQQQLHQIPQPLLSQPPQPALMQQFPLPHLQQIP